MVVLLFLLLVPHVFALPQLGLGFGTTVQVATSVFVGVPASPPTSVPQSNSKASSISSSGPPALTGAGSLLQLTSAIPSMIALNSRSATATTSVSVTLSSASLQLSVFAVSLVSGLALSSAGAPSALPLLNTSLAIGVLGSATMPVLPTPSTNLSLPSVITASGRFITLPPVSTLASISQSAPGLAAVPTSSEVQLNLSPTDISSSEIDLGSILATPSATMLSFQAVTSPVITSATIPDSIFPNLSLPPISVTTTIVSGTASTQSVMQLTSSTTVAVTNTAALATLATLPANSGVSGLSKFASLLSTPAIPTPSATLPDVASLVQTPALPDITTPSVAQILESIGDEVMADLVKGLSQIFSMLATQAEAAAVPTNPAAETTLPAGISSVTGLLLASTAVATIGQPSFTVPTSKSTAAPQTAVPATALLAAPSVIFNRALPLPLPPIPALPGLGSPASTTSLLSISGSASAVPDVLSASAFPPPSVSSNPLAPVASIVGSLPIVDSGTPTNNLSSIVLSTVKNIPIPSDFPAIIQGVKNAAVANLTNVVASLPLIGQANQVLVILQLLGMINLGEFGSLTTLTSIPAAQSALRVISTPDLATVVEILENGSIVQSTAADGLLGNVVTFVQMVEELVPLVVNIQAVVAYLICDGLGLTSLSSVVDGSAVTKIL